MPPSPQPQSPGRKAIPASLALERREFVGLMKQSGLKTRTIQDKINAMANQKGWGVVSERTIERDWEYYRENLIMAESDLSYWQAMREAHFAQMENSVEKMSLHIEEKDSNESWAPFEKPKAILTLNRMLMDYAELRGWNYSKRKFDPSKAGMAEEKFKSAKIQREENKLTKIQEIIRELQMKLQSAEY